MLFCLVSGVVSTHSGDIEGFVLEYEVLHPFVGVGKVYWGLSATEPSVSDVMAGNLPCSGEAVQASGEQSETVRCSLLGGETHTVWVVGDEDGNGTEAVILVSGGTELVVASMMLTNFFFPGLF